MVGRYYTGFTGEPPAIQRIVVRDLTDATEGNAVGIGLADVVLRRAVDRMDLRKTYVNCITAKTPEGARGPDREQRPRGARRGAGLLHGVAPGGAGIVRACDTKHLDRLYVSAGLLPEMLASGADVVEPAHPIHF